MARFLVTGGCGFIGSHLVEKILKLKHNVVVLDDLSSGKKENIPKEAELIIGSITNPEDVAKATYHIDACFHLAAIASVAKCNDEWLPTHEVNLTGTLNLLEASRKSAPHFPILYASSAATYGTPEELPLKETSPTHPISFYGADKLASELNAKIATLQGVPCVGFRFFNVYGPRQQPDSPYSGVISIFCNKLLKQEAITVFGDGKQERDFIYVEDVAEALWRAYEALRGNQSLPPIFNVCRGESITVTELANTIAELCQSPLTITNAPARTGDIKQSLGDNSLLKQHLGMNNLTPLKTGLIQTLKYIATQSKSFAALTKVSRMTGRGTSRTTG